MERQSITFLKYISIIQRNTGRYFDLSLEADQIGSGQQFFLLRIAENEGITMYDLARIGSFDKGTVTKAVQKMVQQGYVRIEVDEYDKRVRHLYITEQARGLIERVYDLRDRECADYRGIHTRRARTGSAPARTHGKGIVR